MRHLKMLDERPFEKIMVFIDGGYFRELLKSNCGNDIFDVKKLRDGIVNAFNNMVEQQYPFIANLIRIYFYDAIVEEGHPKFLEQKDYFGKLSCQFLTLRLGRLVESQKRRKKKFK